MHPPLGLKYIQDERTVKHMLEEQTALLREIRDLLKAKRTLTMTLAGTGRSEVA